MSTPARFVRCFLVICVCCTFLGTFPGSAQIGDRTDETEQEGPQDTVSEELQETIHLFMMFKLKQSLSLDDEQTLKIIPLVRDLETIRWEFFSSERSSLRELRLLVEDDESGDEQILKAMEDLHKTRRSFFEQEETLNRGIAEWLSPRQQAQFQLFHDRFRDEMRQKLRRLRGLDRGGRNGQNRGR